MSTFSSVMKTILPASLNFFFNFLNIKRRQFVFFCFLSMLGLVSEAIGLGLIFPILDYMNQNGDIIALETSSRFWQIAIDLLGSISLTVTLEVILSVFLVATIGRQAFDYIYSLKLSEFYLTIIHKTRSALFENAQNITSKHNNEQESGAYVNALTFQIEEASSILPGYVRMFRYALTFSIYALILGFLNPLFALLGVLQIIAVALPSRYFISINKIFSTRLVSIRNDIISFLNENFYAFKVIRIFSLEKEQRKSLSALSKLFTKNTYALHINTYRIPLIFGTMIGIAIAFQLYVGFVWLGLSGTTLATFIIIILRLAPTAQGFMKQKQALVKQQASLQYLQNMLEGYLQNSEPLKRQPISTNDIKKIELKKISYSYDKKKIILNDFSSTFTAGTITLIAGRSGKGKSTILDIISGHLQPDSGTILLNDTKIKSDGFSSLRKNVSYASQETFLFSGTIERNIILASKFDSRKFDESFNCAHASEIITEFSGRSYNSIQSSGNNLSGGQRQRIALARCFYRDRKILLLDEPTSDLDSGTEREIMKALKIITKEQQLITILVTHNPAHRIVADKVIDL